MVLTVACAITIIGILVIPIAALAWALAYAGAFTQFGQGWRSPTATDGTYLEFQAASGNLVVVGSAVPEIDPAMGGSALSLVAGVLAMIEQRRRRAMLVA